MGTKELQTAKDNALTSKQCKLSYINNQFGISKTIEHLHYMMEEVTKKEINHLNINAACNCISQLNNTINTVISAAKFLSDDK